MDKLKSFHDLVRAASRGVAFTGAGISTESGISDFRSPGGIWSRYRTVYFDEFLASHEARLEYWRMKKALYPEFAAAKPNAGHLSLAKLEQAGRLTAVITQNIDGLHQEAGSRRVLELHGTGKFVECIACQHRWPSHVIFERYKERDDVPTCEHCSGWLKPATISFGQALSEDILAEAYRLAEECDLFIAIGSSLVVEPAASLPLHAKNSGAFLAIINRDPTPLDDLADLVLRTPIGQTLQQISTP